MAQQQRCPQGLGLIMVGTCSFAIRSVKNFLLRSVFFLTDTNTEQVWLFKRGEATHPIKEEPTADAYPSMHWALSVRLSHLSAFRDISLATL